MGLRGLNKIEHGEDIRLEGAAELLVGDIANVFVRMLLARIIHKDVEPTEGVDDLLDSGRCKVAVAEVAGDENSAPALALEPGRTG